MRVAVLLLVLTACTGRAEREAALVEQATRVANDEGLRPVHVAEALPGRFGERAAPALERIHGRRAALQSVPDPSTLAAIASGAKAYETVPPEWSEALEASRDDLLEVLLATTARSGRPPPEFEVFAALREDARIDLLDLQLAARLAGLEMQHLIEVGRPDEAAPLCASTLALGRDVAGESVLAHMIAVEITAIASPSCLAVLKAASPDATQSLATSLRSVADAWPTYAKALERERLFAQLIFVERGSATYDALPTAARALVSTPQDADVMSRLRWWLFGERALQDGLRRLEQVTAASSLPPPEADARIEQLGQPSGWAILAYAKGDLPAGWKTYGQRSRLASALLQLLIAVAALEAIRAEVDSWPASWAEVGLEPIDPRTGLPFQLTLEGEFAIIRATSDGERTPDSLDLVLHPRTR